MADRYQPGMPLPPDQNTAFGLPDLRPTAYRPLVHQGDPALTDQALGRASQYATQVALPLGMGALGGPAAMTFRNMFPAIIQSLLGPFDNPDPRVLQGQGILPEPPDNWFGASKIVNKSGEPLTVYHGTTHKVDEFRHGVNKTDEGYLGKGFYFSDAPTANIYAGTPSLNKYGEPYNVKAAQLPGGNVMPVHLKMENPLEVTAVFKPGRTGSLPVEIDRKITIRKALGLDEGASAQDVTDAAKKLGHDGVIYNYKGTKEYAIFDADNIRSAIGRGKPASRKGD